MNYFLIENGLVSHVFKIANMPFIFVCVDGNNTNLLTFLNSLDRTFDIVVTSGKSDAMLLGVKITKNVKVKTLIHSNNLNPRVQFETDDLLRLRFESFLDSIRSMSFQTAIIVTTTDVYNTWKPNTISTVEECGIAPM